MPAVTGGYIGEGITRAMQVGAAQHIQVFDKFALMASLCAFPGSILAGFSGFPIEQTGFVWFFIWTSLIGIPVALLAVFVCYRVGITDDAPIEAGRAH